MGGTQAAVHNQIFNKKSMLQRSNKNNQDREEGQLNPRGFQRKMDRRNKLYHGCPGGHEDIIVHGCSQMPEMAKRYPDKVPKTVDEMLTRLDDFVRSEEAFASTELPKGEASEAFRKSARPINRREAGSTGEATELTDEEMKGETHLTTGTGWYCIVLKPHIRHLGTKDSIIPGSTSLTHQITKGNIGLGTTTKPAATKADLRRRLKMALESGKLNHLIKDVRQRGRGSAKRRDRRKEKIINMIRSWPDDRKRKSVERDESWMKAPIVFPPLSMEDASDEPLIIEVAWKDTWFTGGTQMDFVGFAGGVVKPLGKIELEVVFGDGGLFRTVMINFTIVWTPLPYNVIFGRTGLRSLRAVSSTIHSMVKFPIPRRIATLVTRSSFSSAEVLVKKSDGSWRMHIEFKDINSACPKDYHPLPDIIESVVGFRYKCFLDVYKGYHQVHMAHDDEEKTAFYTNQGTYCYTKMPFRLKNTEATYQRLVDTAFQSQIGKNLEAYVDDMVIKSNDEKVLIEDIDVTFDNLQRRWTESTEKAFQEMKKVIVELSLLTTPVKEETLYVYVAAETKAVSAVLLAERKGKQCPIHYVSRTLNEAERNYAMFEKLALSLLHMSRRLRRYFYAHPIKVITEQPLKQILNKAQASGKLAKYSVELGAYNISYEPRNAMKGQVLANFLSEAPVGTPTEKFFRLLTNLPNKDDVEIWTLFTDDASNSKWSEAGLVLISPSGVEFAYVLRLNFANTNNEAEYEALLPRLRMARKMKAPYRPTTSLGRSTRDLAECTSEQGWVDELPNVLWAHRTSLKQSNDETPFSLTYGSEVVIPAKIGMPTHRTMMIREDENEDELHLNMDLLQERRKPAAIREAKYKTKMEQYYNQKVRPMSFKPDEYVFRRNEASRVEDQGKLGLKWERPYRVTKAYQNGSYKLQTMGGKEVPRTWHTINLRKCYV
nr:hypothetical protein [Tanacetum cinerariifolium]